MGKRLQVVFGVLLTCLLAACSRTLPLTPNEAFKRTGIPDLQDDLGLDSLATAIDDQQKYFRLKNQEYVFGPEKISKDEYFSFLREVSAVIKNRKSDAEVFQFFRDRVSFYEVFGNDRWGEIFLTGYFESLIQGSRKPNSTHSQALYMAPPEIVQLELKPFSEKFKDERAYRGRLLGNKLVPYFTRQEIDSKGALKKRKLELCYVDPIDGFFMQVQGSGVVQMDGADLQLGYAEKNGQSYEAIGKFVKNNIQGDVTALKLEEYLRTLPPERLQEILNLNPSYVFFKKSDRPAVTYSGVSAFAGRTIATDRKFFPKGALAFLTFSRPVFPESDSIEPLEFRTTSRFVLDQDIGGAINGVGRVDLFCGRGRDAKKDASVLRAKARLIYLVPKRGAVQSNP